MATKCPEGIQESGWWSIRNSQILLPPSHIHLPNQCNRKRQRNLSSFPLQMHCGWMRGKLQSSKTCSPSFPFRSPKVVFSLPVQTNISPKPSLLLRWGKGLEGMSLSKKQSKVHIIASLNLIPLWNLITSCVGSGYFLQFLFKTTIWELILPHKNALVIFRGTLGLMDHEKNLSQGKKTLTGLLLCL